MSFDINAARQAGYSDNEIKQFLDQQRMQPQQQQTSSQPQQNALSFDVQSAKASGYSDAEIRQYLTEQVPKESSNLLGKAGRLAGQVGLGALETLSIPYDIASMQTQFKGTSAPLFRRQIAERIQEYRQKPNLSESEQKELNRFQEIYANPDEFLKTTDISVPGIIEKVTGIDASPKGFLEKTARIGGLLKKPGTYKELAKIGQDVIKNKSIGKDAIKALIPSKSAVVTAPGIAAGLQLAEEGEYGVPGTIAASIVGGALANAGSGVIKATVNLLKQPKKEIAKAVTAFTPKDKKQVLKGIINDFRENGIQADLGSITDNNFIRLLQTKFAQSGLFGKDLEEFIKSQSTQIKEKYRELASTLGNSSYETKAEASKILQDTLLNFNKKYKEKFNFGYGRLREIARDEKATVNTQEISKLVNKLLEDVSPGSIKSSDTKTVINTLNKLKNDFKNKDGNLEAVINTKTELGNILDWDVKASTKNLLKSVVGKLDESIKSYKGKNGKYGFERQLLDRDFSNYKKLLGNKKIMSILNSQNSTELFTQMNSVDGIIKIKNALKSLPEGNNVYNSLAKTKFEDIFNKSNINSSTEQIKLGSFKNIIDQGNNAELLKELLGKENFSKLKLLSSSAEKLQKSLTKYFNSSQTASTVADGVYIVSVLNKISSALAGNPWPLVKKGLGYVSARQISKLLSDPSFLKEVENIILSRGQNISNEQVQKLKKYFQDAGIEYAKVVPKSEELKTNSKS